MTSVTPIEKKKANNVAKFIGKVLGRGGENIIFPALGFFVVLIIWSIIAKLTESNLSKLPTIEKTIQDSIPYLQNFFSTTTGDEGIFFLTLYSLGRVAIGFAIATIIAVPLGFWVGTSQKASKLANPFLPWHGYPLAS